MRHLLIVHLTQEQIDMFMDLAGMRIYPLIREDAMVDKQILFDGDIVFAELDPQYDTEQRDPAS